MAIAAYRVSEKSNGAIAARGVFRANQDRCGRSGVQEPLKAIAA